MKKIWGIFICATIVLACGAVVLFTGGTGKQSVKASPFQGTESSLAINYTDNNKFVGTTKKLNDLQYKHESFVQFGEYENCGAYMGTKGTFTLALSSGRTLVRSGTSATSWVEVTRAPSASETGSAVSVGSDLENTFAYNGNGTPTFSVAFSKIGYYQIKIYHAAGGQNDNTVLFFVVQKENPQIHADFAHYDSGFSGNRSELLVYSNLFPSKKVKSIHLGFAQKGGELGKSPVIDQTFTPVIKERVKNSAGVWEDGQTATFLKAEFDNPDNDAKTGKKWERWVFELAPGTKKATNGVYKVTFRVKYDPFENMHWDGRLLTPGVLSYGINEAANEAFREVDAFIEFRSGKPGTNFPVWTLFMAAGIIAALGGGYYGMNYLIARSQKQHGTKQQQAQVQREETDRENLEKMRERMNAPE